jgi:multidrug efflux pump subunit AcrB
MNEIPVWSKIAGKTIPMGQVIDGLESPMVNSQIWRRDRQPCITVQANPLKGLITPCFERVQKKIEGLDYPEGYSMEWGGEYENTQKSQGPLFAVIPMFMAIMFLCIVLLFNNIKQPIIICSVVPLCLIGVTGGLLIFNAPFGFMSLLGVLSLSGMLIKNGIVLMDEVNANVEQREQTMTDGVVNAGISRILPVSMAAATTVLGMLPLAVDPFYSAMAVTIIGGLSAGTVLTLIIVPVMSAIVYNIDVK